MRPHAVIDNGDLNKRRWIPLLTVAVALLMLPAPGARAEGEMSIGCAFLNQPILDSSVGSHVSPSPGDFNDGEVVTVAVGETTAGEPTGATLTETGSGLVVNSITFPGTLSYTIPSKGFYGFLAEIQGGEATFNFNCTMGSTDPTEPTDPTPPVAGFCGSGAAFGEHHSELAKNGDIGKDGYNPGSQSGYAVCKHGDSFNTGKKVGPKSG